MSAIPTISAAIITLNEQQKLPGLLERLDWVDEIVLVDGGSTDATVDIARRFGCRVWCRGFDTFANQRNFAIERTTSQWVLSIDADERPTLAVTADIRRRLGDARYIAYRIPIRSRIFGRPMRYSGTQDDRPIRLFRREMARWQGDVHEVLRPSGRVGRLHTWLEHETLPDLSSFLGKMNRYTTLEARRRVRACQPPRWRDQWLAPTIEVLRRFVWKKGCFDGPEGWAFCALSGLSAWVLAHKHHYLWEAR